MPPKLLNSAFRRRVQCHTGCLKYCGVGRTKAQRCTSREKICFMPVFSLRQRDWVDGFLPLSSVFEEGPDECSAVRCNDGSVLCLMTPNLMPLWASRSYLLRVPQIYFLLLSAPRVLSCALAVWAAEENNLYAGWPWRWYRLSFINLTWFVKPLEGKDHFGAPAPDGLEDVSKYSPSGSA